MKREYPFSIVAACAIAAVLTLAAGVPGTYAIDPPTKVRIIYTNDTLGYLEPCGCGGRYEGGLARRAPAIARLLRGNPNSVILDSGNLSDKPDNLGIISSLMTGMHYDAIGIGKHDSALLGEFTKQTARSGLKVIDTTRPADGSRMQYLVKDVAGVSVGVVSFGGNASSSTKAIEAFNSAYKTARGRSDVLILLDQGGICTQKWLEGNAKKLGAPDLVIGSRSKGIATQQKTIGKTHILPTSELGRHVGVADVTIAKDRSLQVTSQLILINKTTDEDPAITKRIEEFLLASSKQAEPTTQVKGTYTSPESCKGCHEDIYVSWRKTAHAKAVSTLVTKNRMIDGCLPCHSEEYRRTAKSTRNSASVPAGVECATCHASVVPHGHDGPADGAVRKVDAKLCITCHDSQRSPAYNQAVYMKKIAHKSSR